MQKHKGEENLTGMPWPEKSSSVVARWGRCPGMFPTDLVRTREYLRSREPGRVYGLQKGPCSAGWALIPHKLGVCFCVFEVAIHQGS